MSTAIHQLLWGAVGGAALLGLFAAVLIWRSVR